MMPSEPDEMRATDFSNFGVPPLDWQLATEDAEILGNNAVRIGDSLFSGFDITVAPELLTPFNALVDSITAAPLRIPWRCSFLIESGGLQAVRIKEQFTRLFTFAAPTMNGRIRDAIGILREVDGSEDAVIRLRISFATWARVRDEDGLRRNSAILRRSVERWGNSLADGATGDPLTTVLATVPATGLESTAPAAAAPLKSALGMAPISRQAGPWTEGAIIFRTADGKNWPYQPGSSLQDSWVEIFTGTSGSGKSVAMNAFNLAAVLSAHPGDGIKPQLPAGCHNRCGAFLERIDFPSEGIPPGGATARG